MNTFAILALIFASSLAAAENGPPSVPLADAPELAALGKYAVGVQRISVAGPAVPAMALPGRTLAVHVWYPANGAVAPKGPAVSYPGRAPVGALADSAANLTIAGLAVPDAAPAQGTFPLVLLSHGFGGWATFLSYLGENLASKGYVVASIDHADQPFADIASFQRSFGSVLAQRSRDQQLVLARLLQGPDGAGDPGATLAKMIDTRQVGLIGYSMGGYGALTSAGAAYDRASSVLKSLPEGSLAAPGAPSRIGALVLLAPWGGQPESRAWTGQALAAVTAPTLLLAGDQDDIVNYREGVAWLFGALKGSSRRMLVYQNARHNIGGNPAPADGKGDFASNEYFEEPVWRKDRIMAINQHVITAFLDLHLKGQRSAARFIDVAPQQSNQGRWPMPFGSSSGAAYAGASDASKGYWPGFQRRWAVGLEMHAREAGQ